MYHFCRASRARRRPIGSDGVIHLPQSLFDLTGGFTMSRSDYTPVGNPSHIVFLDLKKEG